MTIDLDQRLLLQICRCPNIAKARADHSNPCASVVGIQVELGDKFQLPEPWNGDIVNAKLLFVSSNPSIDTNEAYPTNSWSQKKILDFFQNRFHPDRNWTKEARRVLSKDEQTYVERRVPYWDETKSMAKDAFGRFARPGFDYALTEIVHCKSKNRQGVKSAAKTCFDLWMNPLISLSDARVIIVLGGEANQMMSEFLELDGKIKFHRRVTLGSRERIVLFLPAPGSNKTRKISKVFSDSERNEIWKALNF